MLKIIGYKHKIHKFTNPRTCNF